MNLKAFECKFLNKNVCCARMPDPNKYLGEEDYLSPPEDILLYVVAVNTLPAIHEDNSHLEVFGIGKTLEDALLQAVSLLVTSGHKGISFDYMRDLTFLELIELIRKEEGCIECPPPLIKNKEEDAPLAMKVDSRNHPYWLLP